MKSGVFLFFVALATTLCVLSCNDESIPARDVSIFNNFDYIPLETGHYVDYVVDSTIYITFGEDSITSTTYIREQIGAQIDSTGDAETYELQRFKRSTEADPWILDEVWAIAKTAQSIDRIEGNQRFLNIAFPFSTAVFWDGTSFFDSDASFFISDRIADEMEIYSESNDFRYLNFNVPQVINGMTFDSTATILQADNRLSRSITRYRYATETYATGVGLVAKTTEVYDTNCDRCCGSLDSLSRRNTCLELSWPRKLERGYKINQRVLDFN